MTRQQETGRFTILILTIALAYVPVSLAWANSEQDERSIPDQVLEQLKGCVPEESQGVVFSLLLWDEPGKQVLQVLRAVANNGKAFAELCHTLVDDAKLQKSEEHYRDLMMELWSDYLKNDGDDAHDEPFDAMKLVDILKSRELSVGAYAFLESVSKLDLLTQKKILASMKNIAVIKYYAPVAEHALGWRAEYGKGISVGLLAGDLAYEAFVNIRSWWKGDITGKRCAKNIIDRGLSVAAGLGGAVGGAAIGNAIVPGVGAVIGSVVGSIVATGAGAALSDWLTLELFDLPKEAAVENAYKFLGLTHHASNGEINSKYRRLAIKYHPDKGGDEADWHKLQMCFGVIKVARGED